MNGVPSNVQTDYVFFSKNKADKKHYMSTLNQKK